MTQNESGKEQKQFLVGITDHILPPADLEQEAFPEAEIRFLEDWRAHPEKAAEWRRMDALLVWHWPVDRETVAVLDRCKIVVRYGVGYELLDLDALAERGIPACNTPDYGVEEVADSACALILAILRKTVLYDRAARAFAEGWQEHLLKPHARTSETTLGLVGVGRIGTAVVNRMKPFGCRIVGYDPYKPSGHEKAVGYARVNSLEALLEQADIVSIHCPLNEETRGMIGPAFLERMKPGASLVNTARGGIVAGLDCIEEALRKGRLACAYFDVLPDEPPRDHPLIRAWREDAEYLRGRFFVTPHCAYYSDEAGLEMRSKAAETARLYLLEKRLRNTVS